MALNHKPRVVVLGGTGMLGSTVVDLLSAEPDLHLAATVRTPALAEVCRGILPAVEWRVFEGFRDEKSLAGAIEGASWVVNAIGLTKPYVHDDNGAEIERAIWGNSLFPFNLAAACEPRGAQIIQIGTDCVYSGERGRYDEASPHDPLDVYGKTKSLGEVHAPHVFLLRTSIIGPEPSTPMFLLEWLRRQPNGAAVNGWTDHLWNGVTTVAFARLCLAVVRGAPVSPGIRHVVPGGDDITKADLLRLLAHAFGRDDIEVVPGMSSRSIDRTLRTEHRESNIGLWAAAGYPAPPTIPELVTEVAQFRPRLTGLVK